MPARMIRESACSSPTLAQLSPEEERLWWRLLTTTDDCGYFRAEPGIVLGACFPLLLGQLEVAEVAAWMDGLARAGLIDRWSAPGGRIFGRARTFEKYNVLRPGRLPRHAPPADAVLVEACPALPGTAGQCPAVPGNARLARARAESESESESEVETESECEGRGRQAAGSGGAPESKSGKPEPPPEAVEAADYFRAELVARQPSHRLAQEPCWLSQRARWARDLDLLVRRDGRSWGDVRALVDWSLGSAFWQAHIQTPKKLREKWDTLVAQRDRAPALPFARAGPARAVATTTRAEHERLVQPGEAQRELEAALGYRRDGT